LLHYLANVLIWSRYLIVFVDQGFRLLNLLEFRILGFTNVLSETSRRYHEVGCLLLWFVDFWLYSCCWPRLAHFSLLNGFFSFQYLGRYRPRLARFFRLDSVFFWFAYFPGLCFQVDFCGPGYFLRISSLIEFRFNFAQFCVDLLHLSLNRPWRLGRRLYIPRRRLYLRYYRPLHNSRVARDTLLLVVHSKCCLLLRALQRHSFRRTIELLMVTLNLWHLDLLHMIRANSAEVI
jgi:hypothetical protein